MARVTKADLEEKIKILEESLANYKKWLLETDLENGELHDKINQLSSKVQALEEENQQLKDTAKNENIINGSHNERHAGRKPKSEDIIQQQINQIELYLEDGKTVKDIISLMGISERTYYRLKRLAKDMSER